MPTNKIKELRKSGKLKEALQLALNDYEAMPNVPFTAVNLAWVYYDYCKQYSETGNVEKFQETFLRIKELNLLPTNKILNDTLCWRFLILLKRISTKYPQEQQSQITDTCFNLAKALILEKPGDSYTILFKAFYQVRNNWNHYTDFCDWWDLQNFQSKDYQCDILENGKKMPISLAEGAYIAYARDLLKEKDKEKIQQFLPYIQKLNEEHPEMNYPGFFIGKLLLSLGDDHSAINALLPFARKKRHEFWIWQLLAQAKEQDKKIHLACLLRAVHCRTKEVFLGKVRQELANLLIDMQNFKSAKEQILLIIKNRAESHYKIPYEIQQWTREPWYDDRNAMDNNPIDIDYMAVTNKLLMEDLPSHTAIVTYINKEKKIMNIVYGKEKSGFFKYTNQLNNVKIGDALILFFNEISDKGYIKPISIEINKKAISDCDFYRHVTGVIHSNKSHTYFFLQSNEVKSYIPLNLIQKLNLQSGNTIKANIIYDQNRKKNQWEWRCLTIERTEM